MPYVANQYPFLEVLANSPSTASELEERTRRARSTLSEALTILTKQGIIVGDGNRPQRYSLAEAEL